MIITIIKCCCFTASDLAMFAHYEPVITQLMHQHDIY